jgi:23S rRNA (cytidine2498-2'-O)-methyltransferase
MHLLMTECGTEPFLIQELRRAFPHARHEVMAPGLVASSFELQPELVPTLVFSRQFLAQAERRHAESISQWAQLLVGAVGALPENQPWYLHIVPHYGSGTAGQNRCRLIQQSVRDILQRKERHRLRALRLEFHSFTADHSLIQLLLTAPDEGHLSIARAPLPFHWRRVIWPFPEGEVPIAVDKQAPSRAFAKLLEAEQRLGRSIQAGESAVDLGAAPGSWTYVALRRGARVAAVDRAPLRDDLMNDPGLTFQRGDAFKFEPARPVDWLLCDVIAAPLRSVDLLLHWVRRRYARNFVVTIKFKGTAEYGLLERLKYALPPVCEEFFLTRLCANKNEVCAFGRCDHERPRFTTFL